MKSVVISTDPDVRAALRRALDDRGLELAMEIAGSLGDMTEEQIAELRRADPELVCLDFDEDPATAVSFARFLTEGSPRRVVIGLGPALLADVLLEAMRAGVVEYL
ncbi:MAG: hypothetical protein ACRDKW_00120, partial [Actinomycetota bacterium]